MSKSRFSLYRYQIIPKDRYFQGDLYGFSSADELIAQKNNIFAEALRAPTAFKSGRSEIKAQLLYDDGEFLLFRVAVNRALEIETKDFASKTVDTWPKVWVAIWNQPDTQIVAVQARPKAFQQTRAVIKVLSKSLQDSLSRYQLNAAWEPMVEKRIFWDLIHKHEGRIKKVEFELVTPNMASISKALPESLKELAKKSNAVKSTLALEADSDSALVLNEGDEIVSGLAEYTSEGGGNVSISLSGVKRKIHTSTTVKEFEISDAKLEGDPKEIADILKGLLR